MNPDKPNGCRDFVLYSVFANATLVDVHKLFYHVDDYANAVGELA